jgi:hypothetical protein
MEGNMLATTLKTENRVLESSLSRMAGSMKVNGSMESSTAGGFSKRKIFRGREYGKMGNESNGSMSKRKTQNSKSLKTSKNLN